MSKSIGIREIRENMVLYDTLILPKTIYFESLALFGVPPVPLTPINTH